MDTQGTWAGDFEDVKDTDCPKPRYSCTKHLHDYRRKRKLSIVSNYTTIW